jgi:hypothetical protein
MYIKVLFTPSNTIVAHQIFAIKIKRLIHAIILSLKVKTLLVLPNIIKKIKTC